jgi:isopenicillin N synthase-like dioxygenase
MAANDNCDTAAALAKYHESGGGVRGLVESGITTVPPYFRVHAPGTRGSTPVLKTTTFAIPTIDLSLPRTAVVSLVGEAARTCGLFYVTNHGIDAGAAVSAVRTFHELPLASRSPLYTLAPVRGVTYSTMPYAPGAGPLLPWRDCLRFFSPKPDFGCIPEVCRDALVEHQQRMEEFGKEMAGIMLEALGVGPERLAVEAWIMAGHYYPPCPEPELVVGSLEHTDPCVLTVLAQDNVGGLQFRLDGGNNDGSWVDVPPVPGALVVNIGDVLKVRMYLRIHLPATRLEKSTSYYLPTKT